MQTVTTDRYLVNKFRLDFQFNIRHRFLYNSDTVTMSATMPAFTRLLVTPFKSELMTQNHADGVIAPYCADQLQDGTTFVAMV
ncbi:hypothetical protein ACO0LB_08530 [Undibacterium sp. SXout7W]|uniref:hypothetical protein n=1 Tax=Undibacterium sp. SXout7W TaxID=3413049 RepID=UPI003BF3B60D